MIGKTIAHYRITEKLGEGGMGVVYKADDTKLHRAVALKFLPPQAAATEADRNRFTAEARAAAALDHPNICTIYEIGEADAQLYIAMAFVEGETVRERIDRDGPLPPLDALRIALQVAEGLAAAHDHGIVHRDIKSANVMVTPKGQARIMDFGLAEREAAAAEKVESSTLGTIAYGSPEQSRGEPTDFHTDIWSFGITLYEMLTGELPFRGDYPSAITYSVLNESPAPPSSRRANLPDGIDELVSRCVSKFPEDRGTTAELVDAVRELHHSVDPSITRARGARAMPDGPSVSERLTRRGAVVAISTYIVVAMAAFFGVGMISERLMLSPDLKLFALITMLLLLPTVAILSARGKGRELLVIPANLGVAALVLAIMFSGRELGATTQTISVTDEEGRTVERTVPRSAYLKRVMLFPFENGTDDPKADWVALGVPTLLELDLYQDAFVQMQGLFSGTRITELQRSGFTSWKGVPIALKAKMAREDNMPFFVTGTIRSAGESYAVEFSVVKSETGRPVMTETLTGTDLFSLGEHIGDRVRSGIGVPEWQADEATAASLTESVTSSLEAFREYVLAAQSSSFEENYPQALSHLEAATRADSTFAYAWTDLFHMYRGANRAADAENAVTHALRHSYKLPERHKLILKANYFMFRQEPDKALTLSRMMVELYPNDSQGWHVLARLHEIRNEHTESIAARKYMLELDPNNVDVIRWLATTYRDRREYEQARELYERVATLNRESAQPHMDLGDLYRDMALYQKAWESYERAQVVDPQSISARLKLASLARRMGRFDEALEIGEAALEAATTSRDRVAALKNLETYYDRRGMFRKSIALSTARYELEASITPQVQYLFSVLEMLHRYVHVGDAAAAFEKMDEIGQQLAPPLDTGVSFGYVGLYSAMRDAESAAEYLPMMDTYIKSFGVEFIRFVFYLSTARIEQLRGNYDAAITAAEKWRELRPSDSEALYLLGSIHRMKGDANKALTYLREREKYDPGDPECDYELALALDALGKHAEARKYLDEALATWVNAEPEYREAADARTLDEAWKRRSL